MFDILGRCKVTLRRVGRSLVFFDQSSARIHSSGPKSPSASSPKWSQSLEACLPSHGYTSGMSIGGDVLPWESSANPQPRPIPLLRSHPQSATSSPGGLPLQIRLHVTLWSPSSAIQSIPCVCNGLDTI